jgi:hypothetical protein
MELYRTIGVRAFKIFSKQVKIHTYWFYQTLGVQFLHYNEAHTRTNVIHTRMRDLFRKFPDFFILANCPVCLSLNTQNGIEKFYFKNFLKIDTTKSLEMLQQVLIAFLQSCCVLPNRLKLHHKIKPNHNAMASTCS